MESELTAISVIGFLKLPIIFFGLVGNFLSFLVFSRKKFSKYSISVYFRAMAIAESFVVYQFVYDIIYYFYGIKLGAVSNFWCKIHYYVPIGIMRISPWILAAFSIDKMIHALGKRQRFPLIQKKNFQVAVVVGIVIFRLLIYSFVPIQLQLKQAPNVSNGTAQLSCRIEDVPNFRYLSASILFEANLIPFGIMMISTIVIIIKLNQSRRNLKRSQRNRQSRRKKKDLKFSVNSVMLNILDVLLEVPVLVTILINSQNSTRCKLFMTISLFLFYLSYSISFLVHLRFNRLFRNEFLIMLRIKKQPQPTVDGIPLVNNSKRTSEEPVKNNSTP
jgi:hypothetical protein